MTQVQTHLLDNDSFDAVFSKDRKYRYQLSRVWDRTKTMVAFIGLNPSTADEIDDDPTIRRCINFAKLWGYGGIYMLNLFALRSTDPNILYKSSNPLASPKDYTRGYGNANDYWIRKTIQMSSLTVACWGNHGVYLNRGDSVFSLLKEAWCFAYTKDNQPKHPLYIRSDASLIRFKSRANHIKAFTYEPKIQAVLDGVCRQTIRPIRKKEVKIGQVICFHGWAGRPYWSEWNWRRYFKITEVMQIQVYLDGVLFPEADGGVNGMWKSWTELDEFAKMDGVQDGITLGRLLHSHYGLKSRKEGAMVGKPMYVIRW